METSIRLLQAMQNGDLDSQEQWAVLYRPYIRQIARRTGLKSDADLDDVTQDVIVAFWKILNTFRRIQAGSLRRWLIVTTRRTSRRFQGRKEASIDPVTLDQTFPFVPSFERTEILEILNTLCQRLQSELSSRDVQVFYKTVIEGIEIADVANHFGVTSNVVYLARSRVLRRVRECMQDLYGHDILFN